MPVSAYVHMPTPMPAPFAMLSRAAFSPMPAIAVPLVQCRGLKVDCGGKTVLDHLDVDVNAGITCLIGRNGAARKALLRVLCGVLRPADGQVRVLGVDPFAAGPGRQAVGYLTHRPSLHPDLSVRDNLKFWTRVLGLDWEEISAHVDDLVRRFGLHNKLDLRAAALSRGLQQRVALARALLPRPKLLLMDEPGIGLDAFALREFHALVDELADAGVSAIYATHALAEAARLGDQFLLLASGTALRVDRRTEPNEPALLAEQLLQRLTALGTEP